jgi:hypothetical protein
MIWPAAAADYRCPPTIETRQSMAAKPPRPWEAIPDVWNGKQLLENVQVYDGPPKDGASLVPDNESSEKDPIWTFAKNQKRRIWIACFYSQSFIRLVQELPPGVEKCTLLYKRNSKTLDHFSCH